MKKQYITNLIIGVLALVVLVLSVGLAYERGHNNGYNEGWNDGTSYNQPLFIEGGAR